MQFGVMEAEGFYEDVQNCPEIKKQYDPIHKFLKDAWKLNELIKTDSTNKRLNQDATNRNLKNIVGLVTGFESQYDEAKDDLPMCKQDAWKLNEILKDSKRDDEFESWFKRGMQFWNLLSDGSISQKCNSKQIPLKAQFCYFTQQIGKATANNAFHNK